MSEDFNQNEESNEKNIEAANEPKNTQDNDWIKYLLITLGAFLGAFLAVYFVADMTMHRYFYPSRSTMFSQPFSRPCPIMMPISIDSDDVEMKEFDDLNKSMLGPFSRNKVNIKAKQEDDFYKIIIDLKPFGGNDKNIIVNASPHFVSISGKSDKQDKITKQYLAFSQSFHLPEKISVRDIIKRKDGNKYIIILPISD